MSRPSFIALLAAAAALGPATLVAATSAQMITPLSMSVAGGESKVFSARFYDAVGTPAAGQTVRFVNDACGRFGNGSFQMDVTTDTSGVASATFTATYPPGIVCDVIATSGVSVRWQVITYPISLVYFTVTTDPSPTRPGKPYTLVVTPMLGTYKLYNIDVSARVMPGSIAATLEPATLVSSGKSAKAEFLVTPENRLGDYSIDVRHYGLTQRIKISAPAEPWQDMWWAGQGENGWGVSVVQHDDKLFSVIYAYDSAGKPTWYVIPAGTWNAERTEFSGDVYVPRGSPYSAYDVSKFAPGAPVGHATFTFTTLTDATLDYTIDGVAGHKALSRQDFGPADPPAIPAFGDMYWGGVSQNGWGIAVLQQYRSLFNVWFTYDETGAPTWFVMPDGTWVDSSTYVGYMYRTTGSPWLGRPYSASALQVNRVGNFRMRLGPGGSSFDYTIDGKSGSLSLARQPF